MTRVIAFDVNETLLDLRALDDTFERLLGSTSQRAAWFAQMLQLSFVAGLTGEYVNFTTAQTGALTMLAQRRDRPLTPQDVTEVLKQMSSLPAHPDVLRPLERLAATPLTVVALTNSTAAVAEAQLTNAGIRSCFEAVLSADSVQRLKPAPEPYLSVAAAFGVDIGEVRLVAAHSWDVSGALAAGCQAAFVARPGMVLSPIGRQPDIVGAGLDAVIDQIIARDIT